MKGNIIFVLFLSLFACSCEKDEPSFAELLTNNSEKAWKYISLTVSPAKVINGVSITDWLSQQPDCEQDDIRVYNLNGAFKVEEGAATCPGGSHVIDSGTWTINSGGTVLSHTYPNLQVPLIEVTIEALKKDEFIFVLKQQEGGVNFKYTATLVPY